MKFCPKLVSEINFEPDAVLPCCNIHRKTVPHFPYGGGAVDLEAYGRHVADNAVLLRQGKVCAGCEELLDVADGPDPAFSGPLKAVSINHYRFVCNCRCVYCTCWKGLRPPEYSIMPALRSLTASGVTAPRDTVFVWGGGEPSILREFEEACAYLCAQGYIQRVHTNAIRYSPSLEMLLKEGRGQVNSSIDAGSAAVFRKIKGVDRWNNVLETLRRYREAAVIPPQLSVKFIIFEANNAMAEIAKFFAVCEDVGINHVIWSFDFREVNAGKVSEKTLLAAAYFSHLGKMANMILEPFFVTGEHLASVAALECEHFG